MPNEKLKQAIANREMATEILIENPGITSWNNYSKACDEEDFLAGQN